MFSWLTSHPAPDDRRVVTGFTNRLEGHSAGPWRGANLADHVGDDPASVARNRADLAARFGLPADRLLSARQVHGTGVALVDEPWSGTPPEADALVTTAGDLALAILVADCVPVLLWGHDVPVVAAVHAGRAGMAAGVVPATLAVLRDLGAGRLSAVVGPSICPRCYEVPPALRDAVAAGNPVSASVSWSGTAALDVAGAVVEQLAGDGVEVTWVPGCTREDDRLYSYRRDGQTGRTAGVVALRPAEVAGGLVP